MKYTRKNIFLIAAALLIFADAVLWSNVLAVSGGIGGASVPGAGHSAMYFLDVGQGDSELLELPGGVKIMTDAGPDDTVERSLAYAFPDAGGAAGPLSIDLAIVSHPQLDHFNGYNFMIDHDRIGAFIINGRDDDPGVKQWPQLLAKIQAKHIPLITLGAGDSIHYGSSTIDMLSPDPTFAGSAELNDTGFVERIKTPDFTALLTADTGANIEDWLRAHYSSSTLAVDILKVGHHGSKYSSSAAFLKAVHPAVAAIEVGAHNTYGHPTPETLARLKAADIPFFRTDQHGTIEIWRGANGKLQVKTQK